MPSSVFGSNCLIPYGGQEIAKDQFDVLMNTGFKWVTATEGFVPENSVVGELRSLARFIVKFWNFQTIFA